MKPRQTQDIMKGRTTLQEAMTPQRFQEIRAMFEGVVSRSHSARAPVLLSLREKDSELARELDELLAVHDRHSGFIERPTAMVHADLASESAGELKGSVFGSYQLIELVGQGGMGQVWRANQMQPVRRTVALKVIKAGMDTQEVIRRFETERQALAVMDHPAIAKVFDAGSAPSGRPYFVMEYVQGLPITAYCDLHQLTIRERLKLFIKVCEGIQHAHQKAIIHRDIKPSNVLVSEVDGKPSPRIIDFGVARAISSEGPGDMALTRQGVVLGTPEYMSPEQASLAGSNVDTRADVYSLGVLVYELLVGAVPLDTSGLPLHEVLRTIREKPAPRPSAQFRARGMDWKIARNRRLTPSELFGELRGDLDVVLLKALKRNPENRYGSPSELAGDIARYLRDEPILARPASALYRTRKYIRRHWVSVFAAAATLTLLATFAVWQKIEITRITRERDRAHRVTELMTGLFRVPNTAGFGSTVSVRELLDKASQDVGKGLTNDPEFQAEIMDVLGSAYDNLGLFSQAELLLRRAVETRRRIFGSGDLRTAQSIANLAKNLVRGGHFAEAEALCREALDIRRRVYGPEHPETLKSWSTLAVILGERGGDREAENVYRNIFDIRRRVLGQEDPGTLISMNNLSLSLVESGKYAEGERMQRQLLEVYGRHFGSTHPNTLNSMASLGCTLDYEGRYKEAEKFNRNALDGEDRVLGPEHPVTLMSRNALAQILDDEGRYMDAEKLDREALAIQRRVLGPEHPDTLFAMSILAGVLGDEGKFANAETLYREVIEIKSRVLGPHHPRTLDSRNRLAGILIRRKQFEEAGSLARETRDLQLQILGAEHPDTAATTYTLALVAARKGDLEDAISLLRTAVDHGLRPNAISRLETDTMLLPLHADARFGVLLRHARHYALRADSQFF